VFLVIVSGIVLLSVIEGELSDSAKKNPREF
jgi:hypothetical protein